MKGCREVTLQTGSRDLNTNGPHTRIMLSAGQPVTVGGRKRSILKSFYAPKNKNLH
jgi:hypothetical protein